MAGKRDDLEIVIGADLSGLASDLARGAQMHKNFARDVERVTPRSSDFAPRIDSSGFNRATSAIKGTGLSVRSLASELVGFGAKVAVAGGSLIALEAGLNGISGAFEQLKGSVVMAAEFEQNQISFETMLGSAKRAVEVMADLRKFAAETPFSSKEVTQGARQLLAFGTAADELIPTLKTLGHLSAGQGTPLKDEVYRWGTVKVAGRAMQQDLNQYTTAGHDVYPGIAKALNIDASQVRKFTEDSRVDINALNKSLLDLANVKYAGLLARQADSLKGSWEQMTDAFDRAKLRLGQVIVRELGLKQATKDAEGFANRLERFVDGPLVTGGIRLLNQLKDAVVNLSSEFGKAGFDGAGIFGEMAKDLPVAKELADSVHNLLKDAQQFKVDPVMLAEFVTVASEQVLMVGASLTDGIERWGRALNKEVLSPILKTAKQVGDLIATADAAKTRAENIRDFLNPANQVQQLYELWRYHSSVDVISGRALGYEMSRVRPESLAPDRTVGDDLQEATSEFGKWAREMLENAKQLRQKSNDIVRRIKAEEEQKQFDARLLAYEPEYNRIMAEAKAGVKIRQQFTQIGREKPTGVGAFTALTPIDPLAGLAASAGAFRREMAEVSGTYGSADIVRGVLKAGGGLYLPGTTGLTAHQSETARRWKDEFNPLDRLNRDLAGLDELFKLGGLTKDEYQFARGKEVRGLADSLGLNQPARLPDTVLAGSQEDARLLAQAMSGNQQKGIEDILKLIEQNTRRTADTNANIERAPVARPVNVSPAGGG